VTVCESGRVSGSQAKVESFLQRVAMFLLCYELRTTPSSSAISRATSKVELDWSQEYFKADKIFLVIKGGKREREMGM
jgi:hypothetical protein